MSLLSSVVCRDLGLGLVDPDCGRERLRQGATAREALGMGDERGVENGGPPGGVAVARP